MVTITPISATPEMRSAMPITYTFRLSGVAGRPSRLARRAATSWIARASSARRSAPFTPSPPQISPATATEIVPATSPTRTRLPVSVRILPAFRSDHPLVHPVPAQLHAAESPYQGHQRRCRQPSVEPEAQQNQPRHGQRKGDSDRHQGITAPHFTHRVFPVLRGVLHGG